MNYDAFLRAIVVEWVSKINKDYNAAPNMQ